MIQYFDWSINKTFGGGYSIAHIHQNEIVFEFNNNKQRTDITFHACEIRHPFENDDYFSYYTCKDCTARIDCTVINRIISEVEEKEEKEKKVIGGQLKICSKCERLYPYDDCQNDICDSCSDKLVNVDPGRLYILDDKFFRLLEESVRKHNKLMTDITNLLAKMTETIMKIYNK